MPNPSLDGGHDARDYHGKIAYRGVMRSERRVKLFRIGADQAVEIPPEFELPSDSVTIRKEGDRLIIEPSCSEPPPVAPSSDE
jgi:hypothetical protein